MTNGRRGQSAVLTATLLLLVGIAEARPIPKLAERVTDQAGMLSPAQRFQLDQRLKAYEQQTGHQFALLTIDTLDGDVLEDFSIRVAEAWKLGAEDRDDGLIFIVVKKDRKMRIEVGFGLEGAIPDVIARRILDDYVRPRFRTGRFAEGIFGAFEQLMKAAEGESLGAAPSPSSPAAQKSRGSRGGGGLLIVLLGLVALPVLIFLSARRRVPSMSIAGGFLGLLWGAQHGIFMALIAAVIGAVFGVFFLGGFGGFGGFGGGGGGFGGGFGGGGGDFGGGGASGDW